MKPRLLVAEPDQAAFEEYRQFFREHGFDVLQASDSSQCLRLLRPEVPHAAIIDHELPCPQGQSVVAWLCQEKRLRSIPVLLTSNRESLEECCCGSRCQSPVVAHFTRPFSLMALLETLYSEMPELRLEQCYEQAESSF